MQLNRKKPVACMLELIHQNIWCFLGAMLGTVMMVLISFATPVLLAETVDSVLGTVPSTLPDWLLQPYARWADEHSSGKTYGLWAQSWWG